MTRRTRAKTNSEMEILKTVYVLGDSMFKKLNGYEKGET